MKTQIPQIKKRNKFLQKKKFLRIFLLSKLVFQKNSKKSSSRYVMKQKIKMMMMKKKQQYLPKK